MLGFAASVVINRNPVSSALSLVVSFVGLAALFIMLNAYFIGIIQILVYAGAVMVLFLFIIMLLDLKAEKRRELNLVAFGGGIAVTLGFVAQLATVLSKFTPGQGEAEPAGQRGQRRQARRPRALHQLQFPPPGDRRAAARRHHRRGRPQPPCYEIDHGQPQRIPAGQWIALRDRLRGGVAAPQHHRHLHVPRDHAERGQPLAGRLLPIQPDRGRRARTTTARCSSSSSSPSPPPRWRSGSPSSSRSSAPAAPSMSKTSTA